MSNNPGAFRAMTAWGQVYESIEGSQSQNTRIQIRNLRAYQFSLRKQRWLLLQHSVSVEGAAFREDFSNNVNKPANLRREMDGSISALLTKGYNFHFWPTTGRVEIDPSDIAGIFIAAEARLAIDQPNRVDDRDNARYLMNVGGDYWLSLTAQWNHFKTNADIGMGRFKYLGKNWDTYTMTTISSAHLRRFPPPLR
jgi:hypothetical protein